MWVIAGQPTKCATFFQRNAADSEDLDNQVDVPHLDEPNLLSALEVWSDIRWVGYLR